MDVFDKQAKKRKYFEIIILIVLTVFLLIVFKESKKGLFSIEDKTSALMTKYTSGLMPLNERSELSKEDIVNFALYGNIPIDRKNEKVLIINSDSLGDNRFIITKMKINNKTNNYGALLSKLNLSSDQKSKIDTLLSVSQHKLYRSILLNENESFAINSNVVQLQKDLSDKINLMLIENSRKNDLAVSKAVEDGIKVVNELKSARNFVFVNPDTVLNLVANPEKLKKIKRIDQKKFLNNLSFSIDSEKKKKMNLDFVLGEEFVSVNVPPPPADKYSVKIDEKKLDKILNEHNFEFNFDMKSDELGFKFNIENVPPNVWDNLQKIDKDLAKKLQGINIKIDSVGIEIKIKNDSIKNRLHFRKK